MLKIRLSMGGSQVKLRPVYKDCSCGQQISKRFFDNIERNSTV